MTVQELMELLSRYNPEAEVRIHDRYEGLYHWGPFQIVDQGNMVLIETEL